MVTAIASKVEPSFKPALEDLYWSLLTDRSWIKRQVNSIKLVDTTIYEKRSTYDINCRELRKRARRYGISIGNGASILLPMRMDANSEPIEFDIRSDSGQCLPLASSEESSLVAALSLCGAIGQKYKDMALQERKECRKMFSNAISGNLQQYREKKLYDQINDEKRDDSEYGHALYQLTYGRLLVARINIGTNDVTIVKTREVAPGMTFNNGVIELSARSLDGKTRSNHLCVEAPAGTWISRMSLLFENTEVEANDINFRDHPEDKRPTYILHWNYLRSYIVDRNLKHPHHVNSANTRNKKIKQSSSSYRTEGREYYAIRVYLQPKRSYYLGPHLAVFAISSLVYILLAIVSKLTIMGYVGNKGPWVPLNISAIVTLMIVLPTAHAAVLFYTAEHRILSELHKRWRFAGYILSAFNILLAALMTVLPLNASNVYVSANSVWILSCIGGAVNLIGEGWYGCIFHSLHRKVKATKSGG